uniref:type I restriction endonuclease subunit R, EcoR124 family n=1 Tax=Anaerovibrio sp. TaxID=1872532 RepID=UPI003890DEB9
GYDPTCKTPLEIYNFVNGKFVKIRRTNPDDELHFGKEVSLKVYDPMEIAAGQTCYQIARQPMFTRRDDILPDRRGDLMLLINGMPLFHVELKRSGISVGEACYQIKKYAHEGIFTGFFSLVQIFVAMEPEETLYYTNPGPDGKFNSDFYFHWADFNNEPINDWQKIAGQLISIPEAHRLIGFYTIADSMDGVLKVMRSYQQYATEQILNCVQEHDWQENNQRGGYIWHTTGSGKTMTSFKAAQLIVDCGFADKVIFLLDRIELSTQSLRLYRAFAGDSTEVQDTEDTMTLITKLASDNPNDSLIVSSMQKMGTLKEDSDILAKRSKEIAKIQSLRLVFIVDECHRNVFGEMMNTAKEVFPNALFFGFSGTPVLEENQKANSTTSDIFGNELHRYTIADGIRDKNVLGFDPVLVKVYEDKKLRQQVALHEANAKSVDEAVKDPEKAEVYYYFMDSHMVPMAGYVKDDGKYIKGIEDYVPRGQYEKDEFENAVVAHIMEDFVTVSHNRKFHGIFATSSIPEAIQYYRKFKEQAPDINITCLFDPTIDNKGKSIEKEDGIKEMLEDYQKTFNVYFDITGYANFKKDVAARLAHKVPYKNIDLKPEEQLDLLIVVNQMLTGFDSKWVNRLYLDKVLKNQDLIQAFSRTNRLFDINEKPFGRIYYYRMPHTMYKNIGEAVKLYSGDRPLGLFADRLADNVIHMNDRYHEIKALFVKAGIPDMDKLPEGIPARAKFAKLFREFSTYYQAARIQGFKWETNEYGDKNPLDDSIKKTIKVEFTKTDYDILVQRYKELRKPNGGGGKPEEVTFLIDTYLVEQETGVIDYKYMNSHFVKWLKQLHNPNVSEDVQEETLAQLHKSFAFLSQEDQKLANLFLGDVKSGDAEIHEDWSLQDYINQYGTRVQDNKIKKMVEYLGCDEALLSNFLTTEVTEENIDDYGRFTALKNSIVMEQASHYFTNILGQEIRKKDVMRKADIMLRNFLISGGKDLPDDK